MISRLFQIVYILMEKPSITANELADKLEVSCRTIYRDLDKLSSAGVPVYTNRGKGGGISLLSDYVLNKMVLTKDEKTKIAESLQALSAVGYENEDQALERLQSFFGNEMQDWIEVDFSNWGNSRKEAELFAKLKETILHRSYIEIVYSAANQKSTKRRIKPLKLCFRGQAWYLYAYCEMRKDYRYFKLSRIKELVISEEHFEPVTVGKLFTQKPERKKERKQLEHVVLVFDEKMAYRVYDEFSDVVQMEDGSLKCELDVWDINWFIGYLFSFGEFVKVQEPEELRERVIEQLAAIAELYKKA